MNMTPPVFVWITNKNAKAHSDKYNGVIMGFLPHEPVLLPVDVAQVCFGYGEKDKGRCLLRIGKLRINDSTGMEQALRWLDQFEIEEAVYALPKGLPKGEGASRADSAQGGSGKTSKTA